MRAATRFISSTGQGAPDITPFFNELKSKRSNSGWPNSATYMVGTP